MVRTSRRRVLAGVTMAALAGCVGDTDSDDEQTASPEPTPADTPALTATPEPDAEDTSLPDDLAAVLDPLPASVGDADVRRITTTAPVVDGDENFNQVPMAGQLSQFGLGPERVDRIAVGVYGDSRRGIIVVSGSFGAGDPTLPSENRSFAVDRADGRLLLAVGGSSGWTDGIEAATDAVDGSASLPSDARLALSQVADARYLMIVPSYSSGQGDGFLQQDVGGLNAAVFGIRRLDVSTIQVDAAGVFEDPDAYDREAFVGLVTEAGPSNSDSLTVQQDGRVAVASFSAPSPSQSLRERQPDIDITTEYAEGSVTLTLRSEASVDAERLTLYVDDQVVDGALSGDLASEQTVTVESPPLSTVRIEWDDPQSEESFVVASELIADGIGFESEFDPESGQVTMTYTGEVSIESTGMIEIQHRSRDPASDRSHRSSDERTIDLSERTETLEPGTDLTIADVSYGDRISVVATHEFDTASGAGTTSSHLHAFRARVPGRFTLEQEESPALVYHGEPRDAGNFRLTVGGSEPATSLADAHDTLEPEDSVAIEGEAGQEVVVEWTGEGGPVTTFSGRLEPPVEFELIHDTDGFELIYRSEETYDADAFVVEYSGSEEPAALFAEQYDTLEDGDSVRIEPRYLGYVEVRWTEPEEPVEVAGIPLGMFLQFDLDNRTLTFTGRGEWAADSFTVTVDGETVSAFSGTVSEGDSVELDAETGSEVEVVRGGADHQQTVFSGTVHPTFAMEFDYDASAGEVTITSRTETALDPSNLRVAVHTEDHERRPDAWAEAYDTVEAGDSITLSVPEGPGAVAVEHEGWDAIQHTEFGTDEAGDA